MIEISEKIKDALESQGIHKLMPVQTETIPIIQEGKDMIVFAGTGSGKTLAYLIPVLEKMDASFVHPQAMVLLPTQDLARQVYKEAKKYAGILGIEVGLFIGGVRIQTQIDAIKNRPKLIIGTPGRILDLIGRRKLRMHDIKTLVLDEGDYLVADFKSDIDAIIKSTLKERQILLFSATRGENTISEMKNIMKDPVIKEIQMVFPKQIKHLVVEDSVRNHFTYMLKIINQGQKVIIFVGSDYDVKNMNERLTYHQIPNSPLFGNQDNIERAQALDSFNKEKKHTLVSTDLACRGIDILDIDTVIHMNIPDVDTYIHRSGRTGRMGKIGKVVILSEMKDRRSLEKIGSSLHITLEPWDEGGGAHARRIKEKKNTTKN